jgi:hypothetical protein
MLFRSFLVVAQRGRRVNPPREKNMGATEPASGAMSLSAA